MSDAQLYLPDTPEGRAVALCADAIADRNPAALPMVKKLSRIALFAMVRLAGPEQAARYFVSLSRDALEMRGQGRGRTGAF